MITAPRWPKLTRWFAGHAEKRLKNTFGQVRVRGLESVRRQAAGAPILFVANHVCWWDGLVILYLSVHLLKLSAYAMMHSHNLRKRMFFARVGGFGFDPTRPGDGAQAIRHTAKLLHTGGDAVWIFPQGSEQPQAKRPLGFARGVGAIARLSPEAVVVPVGFCYRFAGEEQPELWISIGAPCSGRTAAIERAVTEELDAIDRAAEEPDRATEFVAAWPARRRRFAALAEWMLATWAGRGVAAARELPPA